MKKILIFIKTRLDQFCPETKHLKFIGIFVTKRLI